MKKQEQGSGKLQARPGVRDIYFAFLDDRTFAVEVGVGDGGCYVRIMTIEGDEDPKILIDQSEGKGFCGSVIVGPKDGLIETPIAVMAHQMRYECQHQDEWALRLPSALLKAIERLPAQ